MQLSDAYDVPYMAFRGHKIIGEVWRLKASRVFWIA